jgi:shikimate dehydrogenase
MKKLALIGRDLSYSKSKEMHNFIADRLNKKIKYDYFSVPQENFENTINMLLNDYDGFNVTIPYKETILKYLTLSDDANKFKSVNTVICKEKVGLNTDGQGFMLMLRSEDIVVKDKNILVLGSGGAAKSCIYKLIENGGRVDVYNRTYEKALTLYNLYGGFNPLKELKFKQYDIIVNTTNVGMGNFEGVLPIDKSYIEKAQVLVDLIYKPNLTEFLKCGKENSKKIINGEKMLFFQAYYADLYYFGINGNDEEAIKIFSEYKTGDKK